MTAAFDVSVNPIKPSVDKLKDGNGTPALKPVVKAINIQRRNLNGFICQNSHFRICCIHEHTQVVTGVAVAVGIRV